MLTRSSEWILNPIRYTGIKILALGFFTIGQFTVKNEEKKPNRNYFTANCPAAKNPRTINTACIICIYKIYIHIRIIYYIFSLFFYILLVFIISVFIYIWYINTTCITKLYIFTASIILQ